MRVSRGGNLLKGHDGRRGSQFPRRWRQRFVNLQFGLLCRVAFALSEEVRKGFLFESLELLLGKLLLGFLGLFVPLFALAISLFPTLAVALVAVPITVSVAISISAAAAAATAASVAVALPFPAPLLVSLAAALFSFGLAFCLQLLSGSPSGVSFGFAFLLGLFAFLFNLFALFPRNLAFLFFDGGLLLSQLLPNSFALSLLRQRLCVIVFVRLGSPLLLCRSLVFANVSAAQLPHAFLDGRPVDELCDDLLCLLVDAGALESTVNQCGSFASVEGKELAGVAFDFLFGHLEDGFRDLGLVILRGSVFVT